MECEVCTQSLKRWILRHDYFFRKEEDLVGFIRAHIFLGSPVAYIIDTTSARSFQYLPKGIQEWYYEHGYTGRSPVQKGFWMKALDYSIGHLRESSPWISILVVKTLEQNRIPFEKSIFWYFPDSSSHVKRVTGGGDDSVATLYL